MSHPAATGALHHPIEERCDRCYTGRMRWRRRLGFAMGGLLLLLIVIILINSGLGVDSDETITDRNRPEIVGER